FILEKGYSLWAPDEATYAQIVADGNYRFVPPAIGVSEILPLREHFDLIAVRRDGMQFSIACMREFRDGAHQVSDSLLELLKKVGDKCEVYTGSISHTKMPVH